MPRSCVLICPSVSVRLYYDRVHTFLYISCMQKISTTPFARVSVRYRREPRARPKFAYLFWSFILAWQKVYLNEDVSCAVHKALSEGCRRVTSGVATWQSLPSLCPTHAALIPFPQASEVCSLPNVQARLLSKLRYAIISITFAHGELVCRR